MILHSNRKEIHLFWNILNVLQALNLVKLQEEENNPCTDLSLFAVWQDERCSLWGLLQGSKHLVILNVWAWLSPPQMWLIY